MQEILKRFFDSIKENSFTEYSALDPSNIEEARTEFLQTSSLRTPNFRYDQPAQSVDYLTKTMRKLDQLKTQMVKEPHLSANERSLVALLLKSTQQQVALLLAASEYRHESMNESAKKRFTSCNWLRYGAPDRNTTLSLLRLELDEIQVQKFTINETEIYHELIASLPDDYQQYQTVDFFVPKNRTIRNFERLFRRYMEPFFRHIPQDQIEFSAEEVKEIVNQTIDQELRPWSGTQFRAEISETKSTLDVDQSTRILWIPRSRAKGPYTRDVVESVVLGHEMIHLFRGIPFEKCSVPALAYGFPGYEESEEGLATACESAISKRGFTPPGIDYYVNIGLTHFYFEQGFDFRRVFEIRRDLIYLKTVDPFAAEATKAACLQNAEVQAFNQIVRATRGTSRLPYTKDLIYFNGNQKIWRHITTELESKYSTHAQMINSFFWCGKIDPLNNHQVKIAQSAASGDYGKPIAVPWSNK